MEAVPETLISKALKLHSLWIRSGGSEGERADLQRAFLVDADLTGADLERASMEGAVLCGANLRDAVFIDANLYGVRLQDADLRGADLRDANLSEADLRGADLTDADLEGVSLIGANLRGAILSNTRLTHADLSSVHHGPAYYSISWREHGEIGRRLHAVEQDGELLFSCGCFDGPEYELRAFIAEGDEYLAESHIRALEMILELHKNP